jgi:hypothetical protein
MTPSGIDPAIFPITKYNINILCFTFLALMQNSDQFQLHPTNIDERDRLPVACNSSTSATTGCMQISEGSAGHGYQRQETFDSNSNCHRDTSTAQAVSVSDLSEQNKTHEEPHAESKPLQ